MTKFSSLDILCKALPAVLASVALLVSGPALAAPDPVPAPPQEKMVVAPKIPDFKPKTREERDMLLGDLYKKLATTEHKVVADAVAKAITKLWSSSFSATTMVLGERARKAAAEKNFELALRFQGILLELDPEFAEGWFRRAQVRSASGDKQGALQDLRRALALDANHYEALALLSLVLHEVGEEKGALEAVRKLKEVHPHYLDNMDDALKALELKVEGQGI